MNITFRQLTPDDNPAMRALYDYIYEITPHEWITRFDDGVLETMTEKYHVFGAFHEEKLVGMGALLDRGLISAAGVLPEYRGRGIQKKLIDARIACAAKMNLKAVVAGVHPNNAASISSLKDRGFFKAMENKDANGDPYHVFMCRVDSKS